MEDVPTILSISMVLLIMIFMALWILEKRLNAILKKDPPRNIRLEEGAFDRLSMIADTLQEMDRKLAQLVRK